MRYAFIEDSLKDPELAGISIMRRCAVLDVSVSGFYDWRNRLQQDRPTANPGAQSKVSDETIIACVKKLREDMGYTPGYRQLHAMLRDLNIKVDVKRLQRLLRTHGYIGYRHRRRYVKTTDSNHYMTVYPNLLQRNFEPGQVNRAWVTDITYLATEQGFTYLTAFVDLGTRLVVGWAMNTTMTTEFVLKAFDMAVQLRQAQGYDLAGTIVHSDRGSQYCSKLFQSRLSELNMRPSMSDVGQCWDNAPGESIWSSLKRETLMGKRKFRDHADAYGHVERWISNYNRRRPHSALGMRSPMNYEAVLSTQT